MNDKEKQIRLEIEGIVCTGCALDMENILLDTDGVLEASINYAEGIFTIKYDPEEIQENEVFTRVQKLGYKTKIL